MPTPVSYKRRISQTRRYAFAAIAVTAVLLAAYYSGSPNFRSGAENDLFGGDYFQEWFGGRLANLGILASHYDPVRAQALQHDQTFTGLSWQSSHYFPLVYPPFYYAIVSPLSHLPYAQAALIWAAAMVVCYLLSATLLAGLPGTAGLESLARISFAIVPAGLLFPPIVESLVMNQKGTLCLLIVTATFILLRRGKLFSAGLCFGWLFFKPQLAIPIMLVMLWKRQFRFVAGYVTTLCLLAIIALTTGIEACQKYVEFIGNAPLYIYNAGYALSRSHCVDSFFHGLLSTHPDAARVAAGIATVTLALVSLRLMKGPIQFDSPRFGLQFSGLILITILISPHLYGYDLSLLFLPFVIILAMTWDSRRTAWGATAIYLVLALFCLPGLSEVLARQTGVQLSVVLMIALLVVLYRRTDSMPARNDCDGDPTLSG